MASAAEERRIHQVFLVSLAIKAVDALLELVAALLVAVLDAEALQHTALVIAGKHLGTHPHDRVFLWFATVAANFSIEAKTFAAIYLASHGIVKLLLVIGLWRNQAWAYPVSLIVFAGFIVYQLYRFTFTHSAFLIVLTVFDLVVMVLVWHEWRQRRRAAAALSN
jgi:uncharacterized membrane protein